MGWVAGLWLSRSLDGSGCWPVVHQEPGWVGLLDSGPAGAWSGWGAGQWSTRSLDGLVRWTVVQQEPRRVGLMDCCPEGA
jgi:hypothetical protein